ncbi:E1-E2 ATPase-domain-containing protein, partial [Naematelia encephala]
MPNLMDLPTHLPSVTLLVSNMHCPSCVESITALLDPISSIKDLSVNLLLRTVTFRVDTSISGSKSPKSAEGIQQDVKRVLTTQGGFQVVSAQPDEPASEPHESRRETEGWMYAFDFARRRKERKQRRQAEQRRQKHFERCDACRLGLEHPDYPPLSLKTTTMTEGKDVAVSPAMTQVKRVAESPEQGAIIRTTLSISGMSCASCTTSIHDLLSTNPDILEININLLSSSGIVKHKSTVSAALIKELIEDGGFEAEVTSSEPERGAETAQADRLLRSVFSIQGMTCASCSSSVDTAIRPLPGIKEVAIDVLSNRGTVIHYPSISAEAIKEAIEDTGFDAELVETRQMGTSSNDTKVDPENDTRKITVRVEGIFCNNCVRSLNAHLASLPLQNYTDFTSSNHTTTVTYKPHDPLDIRQILQGLSGVAPEFSAELVKAQSLSDRSRGIQQREFRILAVHLIVAFIFAIPTFIMMRMMKPIWGAANLGTIVLWPLVTVVQFGVGRLFYERTFHSLYPLFRLLLPRALLPLSLRRTPKRPFTWRAFFTFGSMDLLVVLSTTTSYFASIAMLILDVRSDPTSDSVGTYFDSCVFLIMFILLGRTLESYAKSKTTDSVSLLGQLRPETALLVEPDKGQGKQIANGSELEKTGMSRTDSETDRTETDSETDHTDSQRGPSSRAIPVEHLEIGDLILIPPGSLPPTDGIVVSGKTTFDESSLTGESRPVIKSPNDEIFTGTTNLTSAITVRVTRLGGSTMLEKIISAVSDASSRKAPLEKMAERLTGVFVPMIVYLALIVLAIWLSIALTGHLHTGSDRPGGRVFSALEFAIATL